MDLLDLPQYPMPAGAEVDAVQTTDGISLRCARWPALSPQSKGTICLLQGRSEFIEKYYEVIRDLRARGFGVATFDWRGQGGSDRLLPNPTLGHVRDFSDYGLDLDAFMRSFTLPECRPPFYALAHSMGAATLLYTMQARTAWFERIVATSPMIDIPRPWGADSLAIALRALGLSNRVAPGWTDTSMALRPFAGNPLTSDQARYETSAAYARQRPTLSIGGPTIGWVAAALHVVHQFHQPDFAKEWRVPTLMILGDQDRVVSSPAALAFVKRLRGTNALVVRDARHELMQEREGLRNQFWAAFDAFVPGTQG